MDSVRRWIGRGVLDVSITLLVLIAGTLPARAVTCNDSATNFCLDTVFSGDNPGTPPYLQATFTAGPGSSVTLTMHSFLAAAEQVGEWDFNIDPALSAQLGTLSFNHLSGPTGSTSTGEDGINADGAPGHGFDFGFTFGGGDPFLADSVYTLTCTGCTETSFNFFNSTGLFHTAAHVQSIPGADSGWVADAGGGTGGSLVPEPATLLLLGSGLLGLGLAARVRGRLRK